MFIRFLAAVLVGIGVAVLVIFALEKQQPSDKPAPVNADAPKPDKQPPPRAEPRKVKLKVLMPQADAELRIDGKDVLGEGGERETTITVEKPRTVQIETLWELNSYTKKKRLGQAKLDDQPVVVVDLREANPDSPDKIEVEFIPTPDEVVAEMCKLAKVGPEDVVFDLGCGDGRMVLKAVSQFKAKQGVGIDLDPMLLKGCRAAAEKAGVAERVEFRQGDVLDIKDLSRATVVLLYMGDDINLRLRPILQKTLKPGARVVSHAFGMGDWQPTRTEVVDSKEQGRCTLHLWVIGAGKPAP
ncbi:MAG: cyclopropane-fatty-acyl-phospholipid synthase family protein [Gemmataceae bacterium]